MIGKIVEAVLGRFAVPLAAMGAFALALTGAALWDRWIDDPAVAAAARHGYVLETEKDATAAELAEVRRQLAVVTELRDRFALDLSRSQAAAAAHAEKLESEIAAYETQLVAAGRACRLDRADIDWLRQP